MCLTWQILKSLRVFWYSLVWDGHYFWMLKRRKKFCMCKGWERGHLKCLRQPFQKHLSLCVLFQDAPVYVYWWLDAGLQTIYKLTGLALHTEDCPCKWDASQRSWMGWSSQARLCFGFDCACHTATTMGCLEVEGILSVDRSLKIFIPIKM